jgi:ABC-type transporter Mla subunit MlaD
MTTLEEIRQDLDELADALDAIASTTAAATAILHDLREHLRAVENQAMTQGDMQRRITPDEG